MSVELGSAPEAPVEVFEVVEVVATKPEVPCAEKLKAVVSEVVVLRP